MSDDVVEREAEQNAAKPISEPNKPNPETIDETGLQNDETSKSSTIDIPDSHEEKVLKHSRNSVHSTSEDETTNPSTIDITGSHEEQGLKESQSSVQSTSERTSFSNSSENTCANSSIRDVFNIPGGSVYFNENSKSESIEYPKSCDELGGEIIPNYPYPSDIEKAAQAIINDRIIVLRYDSRHRSNIKDTAFEALRFYLKEKGYRCCDGRLAVRYFSKKDENLSYNVETVTRLSCGSLPDMVQQLADETWVAHLQNTLKEAKNHLIIVTCVDLEKIAQREGYKKSNLYEFRPKSFQSDQPKPQENFSLTDDDVFNSINFVAAFFPDMPREIFCFIIKKILLQLDAENPLPVPKDEKAPPPLSRVSRWVLQSDEAILKCGVKLIDSSNGKKYHFVDDGRAEQIKTVLLSDYPNFVAEKIDILTECFFDIWPSQDYQTSYDGFVRLLVDENLKTIDEQWLMLLFKHHVLAPETPNKIWAFADMLRSAIFVSGIEMQIHAFFDAIAHEPASLGDDKSGVIVYTLCYLMQRSMGLGSKKTLSILFYLLNKPEHIDFVLQYLHDAMRTESLREEFFTFLKSLVDSANDPLYINNKKELDVLYQKTAEIFEYNAFHPTTLDAQDFFQSLFAFQLADSSLEYHDPIASMLTSAAITDFFANTQLYAGWLVSVLKGVFEAGLLIYNNDESLAEKMAGYYIPYVRRQLKRPQRIVVLDCARRCTDDIKQNYLNDKQTRSGNLELSKRRWLAHQLFLRCWRNVSE